MSVGTYVVVFFVMVLAASIQAGAGFGQGLIAAPLLRLVHPELLPGPIVIAGLVTSTILLVRNSARRDLPVVVPALGGRVVGNLVAIALLALASDRGLSIVIGVIVLGFVAMRAAGVAIPRSRRSLAAAGVVSGVGGTIAALGGAPMALLYEQHAQARDFRGPMGWYLVAGGILSVALLALAGRIDTAAVGLGAMLLPPVLVGGLLARWVSPLVDRGYLRPLVLAISGTSALALVLGELSTGV